MNKDHYDSAETAQDESLREKELAYLDSLLTRYEYWLDHYTPLAGIAEVRAAVKDGPRLDLPMPFIPPGFEKLTEHGYGERAQVRREPVDDLRQAVAEHRRIVLLGDPGSGKTVTLWRLAYDYAFAAQADAQAPLPLLIPLGGYTDDGPFDAYLARHLGPLAPHIETYLASGRLVLLLDGLNEMPQAGYAGRVGRIGDVLDRYPDEAVVVTCRALDYVIRLEQLQKVEVSPLDEMRIRGLLHNYLGEAAGERLFWAMAGRDGIRDLWDTWQQAEGTWEAFWAAEEMPKNVRVKATDTQYWLWERLRKEPPPLLALGRNPYLLLMTAQVYAGAGGELPVNRALLLAAFVDTLLNREKKRRPQGWIEVERQKDGLAALAYAMQDERGRGMTVERRWALDRLRTTVPDCDAELLLYLASSATLVDAGELTVRFYHRLLQEYFAAREMGRRVAAGESLERYWPPNCWWEPSGWEETIILLAQMEPDASKLLNDLAPINPVLAARCLLEGITPISLETQSRIVITLLNTAVNVSLPELARSAVQQALGLAGVSQSQADDLSSSFESVLKAFASFHKANELDEKKGYLLNAREEIVRIQTLIQTTLEGDGLLLRAISQWRTKLIEASELVSKTAILVPRLVTHQLFQARQAVIVLELINRGDGQARNISLHILDAPGYSLRRWTRKRQLDFLPRGAMQRFEFTIQPKAVAATVHFEVAYEDQTNIDKHFTFADEVKFLPREGVFQRVDPAPYVAGVPIDPDADAPFVGRLDLIEWIEERLHGPQKSVLVLYGQRRTGKTSLLYQLARGSIAQNLREYPNRPIYPVYIDLQGLTDPGTDLFLASIAEAIVTALHKRGLVCSNPTDADFTHSPYKTFSRFLTSIEPVIGNGLLLLMLDEFEELEKRISDGKLDKDILGHFRHHMQHHKAITFVLVGTHKLTDMSSDYQSIAFNIAHHQEITFLSHDDTVELICAPVAPVVRYDDLAVDELWRATHGHPYFVQLLCQDIIYEMNRRAESNDVTITDVKQAVERLIARGGHELNYMWDQSSPIEQAILAAMAKMADESQEYVTRSQITDRLHFAEPSDVELITALDHLIARRLLEPAPWRTAHTSETAYTYCFNLLRLWLFRKHPLSTVLPRLKERQ